MSNPLIRSTDHFILLEPDSNEKIVTKYFLETAFKNRPESDYGWPIHQYLK